LWEYRVASSLAASAGVPGLLILLFGSGGITMLEYLLALARVARREEGQTAVEYALVLLLIALVLVTVLATGLGGVLGDAITSIKNSL
jgi:Flp pilus assembly pilin Flp